MDDSLSTASGQFVADMTSQNTSVDSAGAHTGAQNESTLDDGCIKVKFSEWEYFPWNNTLQMDSAQVRTNLLHILFLVGGPANVINMAVFFKQGLRDRVNLLLFALALADELNLVVFVAFFLEDFYLQFFGEIPIGPFTKILVNNHFTGFHSFSFVSFVLSAIIAIERCCCVLWPLKYETLIRTRTVAGVIIAVYLIVVGLYFIAVSKFHLVCVYDDSDVVFKNHWFVLTEFYQRHKDLIDNLDAVFYGVALPGFTMIVLITATIITVVKLRQAVTWRTQQTASSVPAGEVALTKMLVGTSVLLIVCLSPACLLRTASLFLPELNPGGRSENWYFAFLYNTQTFVFINSTFNFFVYYKMGSRYRETFWALFSRKARREEREK